MVKRAACILCRARRILSFPCLINCRYTLPFGAALGRKWQW